MTILRFYWIDQSGRIKHPAEEVECADDSDAFAQAAEKAAAGQEGWSIEVWDGARFIGKIAASANSMGPQILACPQRASCQVQAA
jgi:hypothetical protein